MFIPTEAVELIAGQHGWSLIEMVIVEGPLPGLHKFEAVLFPRGLRLIGGICARIVAGLFGLLMLFAVLTMVWSRTFELHVVPGVLVFGGGLLYIASQPFRRTLRIERRGTLWHVDSQAAPYLPLALRRALEESEKAN